jgi:hypothetical protein
MLQIQNFPDGLYRLLQKLAAADGVSLEQATIRLLYEAMYGSRTFEAARASFAALESSGGEPTGQPRSTPEAQHNASA